MRIFVVTFALIAAASAASISREYLAPVVDNNLEYLPPNQDEQTSLSDDGYRYKTVRKLRLRHRRDVSEIVNNEYLPPMEEAPEAAIEEVPEESAVLADDGYRYKTVRRLKYRHRRDVSEIANEYLPPAEEGAAKEYLPPSEEVVTEAPVEAEAPQDTAVLGDDGYQYKTVRRLKYRHRRDVSELPSNEYLPPMEEATEVPIEDAPEESAVLADDGYRYKTVRRLKYRHRRDVSELPSNEYLPPMEEAVVEEAPEESAALADDGYRYKTVRRLKYRHRRDVSEIVNEYLPPAEEVATEAPVESEVPQDTAVLGDDGYQYKTVRRLKYRHRRDVSEIANEYLPPAEEAATEAPVESEVPQDTAVLGDDGYQYKTVRRLKYRHRRDVSEIANEYLPPAEESAAKEYLPPSEEAVTEAPVEAEAPQDTAVLGDDGYQYKTVRRLKYRHRRDVSELPSNEYLPPMEEATEAPVEDAPEESAALADDGYRYKTVRRLKYRHRRDVSELPSNEYLPPAEEVAEAPEESAVLADDGYRYKTVRRLKYRHRRDVSELPSNEYLPPVEQSEDQEIAVQAPEESAVLADDGYRYKAVKRLKYRRH